jgi:hypothetical protein
MRTFLAALLVPLAALGAPLALTSVTSAADAAVATGGTLTVAKGDVVVATPVTVAGKFKKAYAGRKVVLQAANAGKWAVQATAKASAKGAFSTSWKPTRAGDVKLRAVVTGGVVKGHKLPTLTTPVKTVTVTNDDSSEGATFGPGQTFTNGSWTFTFGSTNTNGWSQMADQEDAEPAPAGWTYVIVPVTFTNASKSTDDPYVVNDIEVLGNDDEDYSDYEDDDHVCVGVPNDWADVGDIDPGKTVTANVCAIVPTAALAGGTWDLLNDDADDDTYVTF